MTTATTILFSATFALICIAAIVGIRIVADADRPVGEDETRDEALGEEA